MESVKAERQEDRSGAQSDQQRGVVKQEPKGEAEQDRRGEDVQLHEEQPQVRGDLLELQLVQAQTGLEGLVQGELWGPQEQRQGG